MQLCIILIIMSQSPFSSNLVVDSSYGQQSTSEVSESAFEYLLGEILAMTYMKTDEDNNLPDGFDNEFIKSQRLDEIGFSVGYR